jgi:ADP-ribosyl-[dinitrogen reductase] hydrolase
MIDKIKSALFGLAVGDALGVPVEFVDRDRLAQNPVIDMRGFGTHHQPKGTWSDDSSLAFCLADSLAEKDLNLNDIASKFLRWYNEEIWTPYGRVFDIGIATRHAIGRIAKGEQPDLCGGFSQSDNGNGSLMRILPLLFAIKDKPVQQRYEWTKKVSGITHAHVRSVISCFYYLEFAQQLLDGKDKFAIYTDLKTSISAHLKSLDINLAEITLFDRLLDGDIFEFKQTEIASSGYVLHTLEASIWCLLTTDNYSDAVLKAVNLGDDTDTTAAVTGGLAGILYGLENIPADWKNGLARHDDIDRLCERLGKKLPS